MYRKEQVLWLSGRSWDWSWASWWEAGSVKCCSWVRPDCAGIGQVWPLQLLTVIRLLKRKIENSGDGERKAAERITEGRHDWKSNEKDEWRVNHRPLSASYTLFLLFLQGQPWRLPFKKKTAYELFANETDTRYASVGLLFILSLFHFLHAVLFMILLFTHIDYY